MRINQSINQINEPGLPWY